MTCFVCLKKIKKLFNFLIKTVSLPKFELHSFFWPLGFVVLPHPRKEREPISMVRKHRTSFSEDFTVSELFQFFLLYRIICRPKNGITLKTFLLSKLLFLKTSR